LRLDDPIPLNTQPMEYGLVSEPVVALWKGQELIHSNSRVGRGQLRNFCTVNHPAQRHHVPTDNATPWSHQADVPHFSIAF
jgi:hypothetical protein